jgi:myo-inositol-1(or 4)-monophosphatase
VSALPASARAGEAAVGPDPVALRRLATEVAVEAGRALAGAFARAPRNVASKGDPTDLVSDADRDAERLLVARLRAARPEDGVVGEEGARAGSRSGLTWVVDPLDGTTNFLWRMPHWAVSVAVEDADGALAAVVHDPLRGETFAAARGSGVERDGEPLAGPPPRPLAELTVAGDFAAPSSPDRPRQAELAARLFPAVGHLRSLGSAALDLAWLAAGRVDAVYHERWYKPWDVAAGVLLAREAGLTVRELAPVAPGLSPRLLAAPPARLGELLALVGGADAGLGGAGGNAG